jgi:hypothetical protein
MGDILINHLEEFAAEKVDAIEFSRSILVCMSVEYDETSKSDKLALINFDLKLFDHK